MFQTCYIVDVISWNARKVLESGIPYPSEDNQWIGHYHRFDVIEKDDTFEMIDNHLDLVTVIEAHCLENVLELAI